MPRYRVQPCRFRLKRRSPTAPGLHAWWPLIDAGDHSLYRRSHLAVVGAAIAADPERGRALWIAAAGQRAELVGSADWMNGPPAISVCAWMKTTNNAKHIAAAAKYDGTQPGSSWALWSPSSDTRAAWYTTPGSGVYNLYGTSNILDGLWHFLCATWDGATKRIYVDGQEENSVAYTLGINSTPGTKIVVGSSDGGDFDLEDGLLSDMRIYDWALSAAQVALIYSRGRSCPLGDLARPDGRFRGRPARIPKCDGLTADALRIYLATAAVQHLHAVGTIPGVVVRHAAARNGEGAGSLRYRSIEGLAWKAPGSSSYGPPIAIAGDATSIVLGSGDDADKFVRVDVHAAYLRDGAEAAVQLQWIYNNAVAGDDVTAAEAQAGDVETYTFDAVNESTSMIHDLRAWLDAATSFLEVSADGSAWSSPTSEATGLALGDLTPLSATTLHVRRTIPAAEDPDPDVLSHFHFAFSSL